MNIYHLLSKIIGNENKQQEKKREGYLEGYSTQGQTAKSRQLWIRWRIQKKDSQEISLQIYVKKDS